MEEKPVLTIQSIFPGYFWGIAGKVIGAQALCSDCPINGIGIHPNLYSCTGLASNNNQEVYALLHPPDHKPVPSIDDTLMDLSSEGAKCIHLLK